MPDSSKPDPSKPKRPLAPALPSATILLVRDGHMGLEVFMVERHHRIDFATGALVFPGGKLEESDRAPSLRARASGAEALDDDALALRIGGIRETFEESGVLLARRRGARELLPAAELAGIEARHREALCQNTRGIDAVVEQEDLELACECMVPFAHWITPTFMPKRFDTWFFLAVAPPDQVALHDGHESVDSLWTGPAEAVAAGERKERTVIFPTRMNLQKLAKSPTADEALAAARSAPVVTVFPRIEKTESGAVVRIPEEAGYGVTAMPVDEMMRD